MPSDMTEDIFSGTCYAKLVTSKFGEVPENFRIYYACWLGKIQERQVIEIKGAEFIKARAGQNKGKLAIMVPGTTRSIHITKEELDKCSFI